MSRRSRTFRIAAAGLITIALTALTSPAWAAPTHPDQSSGHRDIPVIKITMSTAKEFTAAKRVHAGWVTFRVGSLDTDYHGFEVVRVNRGHTLAEVLNDLQLGLSGDLASEALGARQLVRDATLMGGVVPSAYAPMEASLPLTPGTYYMFDFAEFDQPTPVNVHTLTVYGHMNWSGMPHFQSVVGAFMDPTGMPMFAAPTDFSAHGSFLFYAQGDEIHEAVFRATRPGVTDQYISEYYAAVLAGGPLPGPSPWTDIQHGANAMSPGQFAVFHLDLPPGPYALACYVPSDETGLPHAYMGMHQTVTLH
jgi:hypothetical protein